MWTDESDTRQAASRAEFRLRLHEAVARVIGGSSCAESAQRETLRVVCEHLGWQVGALWDMDPELGLIGCTETWMAPGVAAGAFLSAVRSIRLAPGENLVGQAWKLRQARWLVIAPDGSNVRLPFELAQAGLRWAIAFPVTLGEQVVGVMCCFGTQVLQPHRELLDLLAVTGVQVGQLLERKRDRRALLESDLRLRQVAEATEDAIWIVDAQTNRVHYASPGVAKVWGIHPQRLADDPDAWVRLVSEEHRPLMEQMRGQVRAGGRPGALKVRVSRPDGAQRWIMVREALVHEADAPAQIVSIATDATAEHDLRERLYQTQKLEAVGQLAGGVAHEFNNILTIIDGYCELAADAIDHPDTRDMVHRIRAAAKRAAGLTRQLLAFGRKQVLQPTVIDIAEVLREMCPLLERLIGPRIDLCTTLSEGLWATRIDSDQLQEAIVRLTVNARDAMAQGGTLTIEARNAVVSMAQPELPAGDYVLIRVTDTGNGMDKATLARIFEPFFTTKGPFRGTGLGLATVFGMVKQSEGHITVESALGSGTTFQMYLPRVEPPAHPTEKVRVPAPGGPATILLVQHDPELLALTRMQLTRLGYCLLETDDLASAFRICASHPDDIQLLITDVMTDLVDCRAEEERFMQIRPSMKVLFLFDPPDDTPGSSTVSNVPANVLQVPFSRLTLAERVRGLLEPT